MHSAVKHAMGLGSLALGVAGIVRPSLFGRLCEATEDEARELGVRDLCVGLAIYASPRVGLAQRAGARQVVLFHHKPSRTDAELDETARRFAAAPLPVAVAAEGMRIEL